MMKRSVVGLRTPVKDEKAEGTWRLDGLVNKFTMLVGPYAHRTRPVDQ